MHDISDFADFEMDVRMKRRRDMIFLCDAMKCRRLDNPGGHEMQVFHVGKDGRLYNYKKEDTEEIKARSATEVQAILRQRETFIHGLGAGGNVPGQDVQAGPRQRDHWKRQNDDSPNDDASNAPRG